MERTTRSGIPIKDFYEFKDVEHLVDGNIPNPGEFPYTRGRSAKASPKGGWIQRELSGEGDAVKSNEQLKYLLSKGQMGIDIIGDAPTMALLDPDHPLAAHAIGTQGVSLCCKDDFLKLFKDIPMDSVSISTSLMSYFALSGLYIAAKNVDVPLNKLRGSLLETPFFSEDCGYATHLPFDLRVRLSVDAMEYCSLHMPKLHAYVEDTYYFSEAGNISAVEEMALGFIQIRFLVREMLRRGLDIDSFAPRIAILVNCSMDFFEEIAKIRAIRRLFAKMMKEEFGAKDPRSLSCVITCHTSGITLTAQQPVNNVVRGTLQALALVLGGVQAMEISGFDEAFRTPSPESHMVGLRTQQIIELETGVTKVVDPLGGSYYVEHLTEEIEKRIWKFVEDFESKGDTATLVNDGFFRTIFLEAMERHSKQINQGELQIVGLNVHQIPLEEDTMLKDVAEQKISPYYERIQEIKDFKANRDQKLLKQALQKISAQASDPGQNLIPVIIEAMEADATIGEIAGTLRMAYGCPYDYLGLAQPPMEGVG